jgi:hypothetical protein
MLAIVLAFPFLSAKDVREAQSILAPGHDNTPLQIPDQGIFLDISAVFEDIAVQKNITGDKTLYINKRIDQLISITERKLSCKLAKKETSC